MTMLASLIVVLATAGRTNVQSYQEAARLFEDGRQRLAAGRYGTARLAFHALLSVYPESPLAPEARTAMLQAAQLEDAAQGAAVVRSVRFEKLRAVSEQEVFDRFREREVPLAIEDRCLPRDLESGRLALRQLLAERGMPDAHVRVSVRKTDGFVDIRFRLED